MGRNVRPKSREECPQGGHAIYMGTTAAKCQRDIVAILLTGAAAWRVEQGFLRPETPFPPRLVRYARRPEALRPRGMVGRMVGRVAWSARRPNVILVESRAHEFSSPALAPPAMFVTCVTEFRVTRR